ncbi:MAG: hypothetical protein LUQ66_04500 [Methanoregula sp.]|nr:hypothetical protein [Methanoregula sp.]
MSISQVFFRFSLLAVAIVLMVPCASAWVFGGWSDSTRQAPVQPGTDVVVSYRFSFSSFETGSTFDKDNTLVMFTDLKDPHWVVTMIETLDDETSKSTELESRNAAQVRLDGWDLSFSRKQFDVTVNLNGKVPALNQSQEIILARIQELDPSATLVKGTLIKKTAQVTVPTPEPTQEPTVEAEDTILEITPEPVTTEITAAVPTGKTTYSPGPDPLLVCGMLAGLCLIAGLSQRRK